MSHGNVIPTAYPFDNILYGRVRQHGGHGLHGEAFDIVGMRAANAVPIVLELPFQVPGLHAREPRRLHAFVAASVRAVTGGAITVVEGLAFRRRRQGGDAQKAD